MEDQVEVQFHMIAYYRSVQEGSLHLLIQLFFSEEYNMKGKLCEEFVSNQYNHLQEIFITDIMPQLTASNWLREGLLRPITSWLL